MASFKAQELAGKTEEHATKAEEQLLSFGKLKFKFGELGVEIRGGSPKTLPLARVAPALSTTLNSQLRVASSTMGFLRL